MGSVTAFSLHLQIMAGAMCPQTSVDPYHWPVYWIAVVQINGETVDLAVFLRLWSRERLLGLPISMAYYFLTALTLMRSKLCLIVSVSSSVLAAGFIFIFPSSCLLPVWFIIHVQRICWAAVTSTSQLSRSHGFLLECYIWGIAFRHAPCKL